MKRSRLLAFFAMAFLFLGKAWADSSAGSTTAPLPDETPTQKEARLAWWRQARFGLFIHYGPISLLGKEISWSRANSNPKCPNKGDVPVNVYDNLYKKFDPEQFNAKDWADIAKNAGMKYVVLTAKHCDGFLLWDSKVSDYNIMATPFKRDICAELAQAVRADGLRIGWYFSPMDWKDPDFRTDRNAAFVTRMQGELRELLSNYGRIDLLWFDTDGYSNGHDDYDVSGTYHLVKSLQPSMIIDNRLDMAAMGAYNDQQIIPPGDYYTPEQRIGGYDDQRPWETCETLETQWSWGPNETLKPVSMVVADLAKCSGGDGNLLLDVGPMPDGRIEPREVDVLKSVGAWLAKNGESIYGTRGGPYKPAAYGACTRKGNTIYVHVLKWPEGGALKLPALMAHVMSSHLLNGGALQVSQSASDLEITTAPGARDPNDTVVALELDGPAQSLTAMDVTDASQK